MIIRREKVYRLAEPHSSVDMAKSSLNSLHITNNYTFHNKRGDIRYCFRSTVNILIITSYSPQDGQSRTVRQFQFTDWPEQGVPKSGEGFIDFIGQVHKTKEQFGQDGPITVHCR